MIVKTEIDVVELALRVAQERTRHSDPDDFEGRRRSRQAFRRWRERIPASLSLEADVPLLVSRHRAGWLAGSSNLVRSLDPCGIGAGSFWAIDSKVFGVDGSSNCLGFVFPGLFDVARSALPVSARRGPAVALNLERIARYAVRRVDDDIEERVLAGVIGLEIAATAVHEAAHAIELEDRHLGEIPVSTSGPIIRSRVGSSSDEEVRRTHGSGWIRGLAHFCHRATRLPAGDWWLEVFGSDVAGVFSGPWSDLLDALSLELASSSDEPIAEIVKRDPPPAFVRLIESRSAASAAH